MGDLAMVAGDAISGFAGAGAEAAAPVFESGIGTIGQAGAGFGEAAAGTGAGIGGGLGDIVGSGAGLFGGTTGLEGTALAGGAGDIAGLIGGGGATALGSAEAFMGAPGASGFNPSAMTPQAFGGTSSFGPASASLSPNVANANAGASVFDTGASPITGVSGTGAPAAGTSASSLAPPPGVTSQLGVDPTATAAATAPQAAKSTSIGDLLGKAGGSIMDSVTKNPVGTALGAAGLGYNIMAGQKQSANQKALTADAQKATANSDQMVASGEALQKYLTDGTLPPAYQQQVDNAINDAKTTAISNAAAQGQPTDPTKNTALAATLAKIDASRAGMQAQVAGQLFSSGSSLINSGQSAANLSGNLYQTLVQNDTAQAANTGKAIATLAAAMNGKSQANLNGITISQG
jgi:hypothetical protein